MNARTETWSTVEPADEGIGGMQRMRLFRDDIAGRVTQLAADLTAHLQPPPDHREEPSMPTIRVYEPALCCNTGVCGPDVDQSLVDFTADLNHLQSLGVDITRHNLANDPTSFAADDTVRAFLKVAGSDGLPLILVDGVTVMTGTYPTRSQLLHFAGLDQPVSVPAGAVTLGLAAEADTQSDGGCGCGPSGCC